MFCTGSVVAVGLVFVSPPPGATNSVWLIAYADVSSWLTTPTAATCTSGYYVCRACARRRQLTGSGPSHRPSTSCRRVSAGRRAILDIPLGKGHVVAYNLNPTHRDLNRSGCRLPGIAIRDWQAPVRQPNTLNEGSRP